MLTPAGRPVLRSTAAALRAMAPELKELDGVATRAELAARGYTAHHVAAQLAAGRWQRIGTAIILHNATPTVTQVHRICLINCGPRALLTSFTAVELHGLRGWERAEVHVLAPRSVSRPPIPGLRLHQVGTWSHVRAHSNGRLHALAPAALVAAASFETVRPAVGLLAATVQQRLLTAQDLTTALTATPRLRHRRALLRAVVDIAQGAHALSEIDFVRLCARFGLPRPYQQVVRTLRDGRRRYLDAQWRLPGGRRVTVEVDGAHHLSVAQWTADQLRQNEVSITDGVVLRYPAVVVREEPWLVADQLRRVLV